MAYIWFKPPPKIPGYKPSILGVLLAFAAIVAVVWACMVFDPQVPFVLGLGVLVTIGVLKGREKTPWRRRRKQVRPHRKP